MPIRPALRWYYPIDWPQLSHWVRFVRANAQCEHCRRPHAQTIACLSDGSWHDPKSGQWRDNRGRSIAPPDGAIQRHTRVVLAAAHLDHDPTNNCRSNLRALCQRCHMLHDQPHHAAQRWLTYRKRWAIGDLFLGLYS
jgi:hypothetical protein